MKIHVVEKPMFFKCECGEQFILGMWRLIPADNVAVVRFLNRHEQFTCCPFCGGKTKNMTMEVERGTL